MQNNSTILYYDCFSGIAGDMNLAALIGLGVDVERLQYELAKMNLAGYEILVSHEKRQGIHGTRVDVRVSEKEPPHRHLAEITGLIEKSELSDRVKHNSLAIFRILAEAEATVHGITKEQVHFHEVGAVDAIVDIVGAAICYELLGVNKVMSSTVELGSGFVNCAHGKLPVPAPATIQVLKGVPVKIGAQPFEATTPTGAAILRHMATEFTDQCSLTVKKTAYGIGHKEADVPNVLRVHLCQGGCGVETSREMLMSCNIDDMNPEMYDFVFQKLFEAGALDVFITPIIMKKLRPANMLSVICEESIREAVREVVFRNTSTLGIRETWYEKTKLLRETIEVKTPYGTVRVKNAYYRGALMHAKPEYDDCKRLAETHGIGILEIYKNIPRS